MKKALFLIPFVFVISALPALTADSIHWSSPVTISNPNQNASTPAIAVNSSGKGMAVWVESGTIQTSRLTNGSWGSAIPLSNSGVAFSPQVVIDASGNATAIWVDNGIIIAATESSGGSWGNLSTLSGSGASVPQLAVDASGNVVAVWIASGVIQSATKLFNGNWPLTPDSITSANAASPTLAVGSTGYVFVAWYQPLSAINTIYVVNKTINGSWSAPQAISSSLQNSIYPEIAVDSNGNATAAWLRYNLISNVYSNVIVQVASCPVNGSWAVPSDLSSPGISDPALIYLRIAYDELGNAMAIWNKTADGATWSVQAMVKPVGQNWSNFTELVGSNLYAKALDLSVNAYGTALPSTMYFDNESASIAVLTFSLDLFGYQTNAWNGPNTISTEGYNGYPKIASSGSGSSFYTALAWIYSDGTTNMIQAASGNGTVLSPPSNLRGEQNVNNFGIFSEYYNTISWDASSSPNVGGYLIFRNGILLARTDATTLQWVDHNRTANQADTYGIATLDTQFSQSRMVFFSFPLSAKVSAPTQFSLPHN